MGSRCCRRSPTAAASGSWPRSSWPTPPAGHSTSPTSSSLTANPEIDGIDLDYEGFAFTDGHDSWASTQPVWVAFVTELAAALHANGKLLSVTIPPTWLAGGVPTGYPVYAQASIAPVVDRLRLMVYDWSVSSPGPISPMSWLNQVIAYSNSAIPAASDRSKLQLGVPSYGRDWGRQVKSTEICPDGALEHQEHRIAEHAGGDRCARRHADTARPQQWRDVLHLRRRRHRVQHQADSTAALRAARRMRLR